MKVCDKASNILMPLPQVIEDTIGYFIVPNKIGIKYNEEFEDLIKNCELQFNLFGENKIIELRKNNKVENEGYHLDITNTAIKIEGSTNKGIYNGMQTLRQLLISCDKISCCHIEDYPKFKWRGFMIDCSRHFITVNELRKLIDTAAMHHLNIFHWHLIDDQGWRLEIPSLPKLTEIGAKRQNSNYEIEYIEHDWYSPKQVQEIIQYAKDRYIDVMPEIELPGHARALLASYPEYGCVGKDYLVQDHWGIFDEVVCAGNDKLEGFLTKIINYVASVFPFKYIHIGGDECPTTSWDNCNKCKAKAKQLGLPSTKNIQSYLTSLICNIVDKANKIPVGWDEVLEGTENLGLPQDLVVMSWRGSAGGIKASSLNHRVIMSPNTDGCYFDYKNYDSDEEPGNLGINTIENVCKYSPITKNMTKEQGDMVLGGQGNIWTEKVLYSNQLEYLLYPRLSVLSERLWNPQNFESVLGRKKVLIKRLRNLEINCYSGPFN